MAPDAIMIFAAGLGKRMGALTKDRPKPMIPLAGRPMIDYAITHAKEAGVKNLVANTHYHADIIEPHLTSHGVTPHREDALLETGGGLRAARILLKSDPVFTMNPDGFWIGPNPVEFISKAWRSEMNALLLLVPMSRAHSVKPVGDFDFQNGKISRSGDFKYTGLQIIRTDRLHEIGEAHFSLNVYWDHIASQKPLHGVVYEGEWCDIGTPEGLDDAEKRIERDV